MPDVYLYLVMSIRYFQTSLPLSCEHSSGNAVLPYAQLH